MSDFSKQVADLTESAFAHVREAANADYVGDPVRAEGLRHHAGLQMAAAQSLSTLAVAVELRSVGLILASGAPVGPSPELAREAFTAAAVHLGLVHQEEDGEDEPGDADSITDRLYPDGGDPADQDVEL